jgi:hypothetical protein
MSRSDTYDFRIVRFDRPSIHMCDARKCRKYATCEIVGVLRTNRSRQHSEGLFCESHSALEAQLRACMEDRT